MSSIKFRSSISFNGNDWTKTRDKNGRTILLANDAGVNYRTSLLIRALIKKEFATGRELLAILKKEHPSYTHADLSQPLRHMTTAGILMVSGKGSGTVYSLTRNAANTWKRATGK